MTCTAIICGSGLRGAKFFAGTPVEAKTEFGSSKVFIHGQHLLLPRHGTDDFIPPHAINHRANIAALRKRGCNLIISVCSAGSLKSKIAPGTFIIPNDVFCPWRRDSFYNGSTVVFTVPRIDSEARGMLEELVRRRGYPCYCGGTYCQTLGPSFETKAEIRFLAGIGEAVGMTAAQEVFLASEAGIPIAVLCMSDNYANGIIEESLEIETVTETALMNREKVETIVEDILNA